MLYVPSIVPYFRHCRSLVVSRVLFTRALYQSVSFYPNNHPDLQWQSLTPVSLSVHSQSVIVTRVVLKSMLYTYGLSVHSQPVTVTRVFLKRVFYTYSLSVHSQSVIVTRVFLKRVLYTYSLSVHRQSVTVMRGVCKRVLYVTHTASLYTDSLQL